MPSSTNQPYLPHNLLELANEVVWTANLEGRLLYANPALERVYGRPLADFQAHPALWLEIIHPDDQATVCQHDRLWQEQGRTELIYRIVRPDGHIRWLRDRKHLLCDETGQPYQIGGIASDITAQKQAEAALRQSEANLAALIENTDDRIWSVNHNYRLIVGNAPFRQGIRASLGRDLMPGENVLIDGIPPEVRTQWQGYYDRALAGERFSVEVETRFSPTPDYRDYRFSPIRTPDGQIVGVAVAGRDITERKRMEAALRVNLEKYRVLFESFPLGITIADRTGQILETNCEAARILGLSADEHQQREIDSPAWQIIRLDGSPMPPEEYASVRALWENRLVENVEMGIVKSTVETTWISVTAAPLPVEGYGVVAVYGDITPRKRAEAVLEARLRLSEFANSHTLDELLQKTLDEAEILTGSQIGFFHFFEDDQKTILLQAWSTHTLQNLCTTEGKGRHHDVGEAGVWVDCIHLRRPVIHQDYASLPHRKGLPAGHAPITNELAVPVLRADKIVAILGVGNKPTDYQAEDVEVISTLANMAWDIVLRQHAEENLRVSLREKEVLLKEIHHRVKNNLQFVSSLLNLQKNAAQDNQVRAILDDSRRRLRGMALVHEQLYRSNDLGCIHFKAYIQDLVSQLRSSMAATTHSIRVKLDLDDVLLPVDMAIPCGLIINELVSNALKYAFPNNRLGELQINLRVESEDRLALRVSDNGVGLPETLNYRHTASLGLQLVTLLARQLEGALEPILFK